MINLIDFQAELEELADVKELAVLEYRDEVFQMLGRKAIGLRYATGASDKIEWVIYIGIILVAILAMFIHSRQ